MATFVSADPLESRGSVTGEECPEDDCSENLACLASVCFVSDFSNRISPKLIA